MYFVYILKSQNHKFTYKGMTADLDKRLAQHEKGLVRSTKSKLPMDLIHVELVSSRSEARSLERYFKSGSGREIIESISMGEW